MAPLTHLLIGWLIAVLICSTAWDRRAVVLAAALPDIDGIYHLFSTEAYYRYHHTFGHTMILGAVLAAVVLLVWKDRKALSMGLFAAVGAHLLCDFVGTNWAVMPLYPFWDGAFSIYPYLSNHVIYDIINPAAGAVALALSGIVVVVKRQSPYELVSRRLDRWIFATAGKAFSGGTAKEAGPRK